MYVKVDSISSMDRLPVCESNIKENFKQVVGGNFKWDEVAIFAIYAKRHKPLEEKYY